jgi:hypothetical protein
MTRSELEHIIRAAGTIADDTEIVVTGIQSVLGQFPNAPVALLASMEVHDLAFSKYVAGRSSHDTQGDFIGSPYPSRLPTALRPIVRARILRHYPTP